MNDVFISYSRRDKVFTQKLFEALKGANRIVWADWDSIPAASDWDAEIKEGIEQAESILFLLSPEWIKSNECRKELTHAVTMGKRLIPILYQMVNPNDVPPELAKINWVYMRDTDDFEKAFQTLCAAMDTDLDWVKTHTRIQVRALEWDKKKRENSFVLRGKDLADGEKFITEAAGKSPEPTTLQGEYILASRKDAARRQRMTLTGVTIALVVSIALGIAALIQRQVAVTQRNRAVVAESTAVSAKSTAVAERDRADLNAKMAFARELTAETKNNLNKDPERSILLALKAVDVTTGAGQPVMMDTYDSLRLAVQASRVRYTLNTDNDGSIWSIAFSPTGDRLATTGDSGIINVWDISALLNTPTGITSAQPILTFSNEAGINSIAFSPDGMYLATGGYNGKLVVWDAATGEKIKTISAHDDTITKVAYSPDGTQLATTSSDGTTKLWDTKTDELLFTFITKVNGGEGIRSLAFSPDGRKLATAQDAHGVDIWDVSTGNLELTLYYYCSGISDVAFSPDGKNLATSELCPPDNLVKVVRLGSFDKNIYDYMGTKWVAVMDLMSPDQVIKSNDHTDIVYKVAFSPDGAMLASASDDNTVIVTDVRDGSSKFTLHDSWNVDAVTYSPDGKYIATGNALGQIKLWDASPVNGYKSKEIPAQQQEISGLAFSPDGTRIATADGSYINPIPNIWPLAGGSPLKLISADNALHPDRNISSIAFSPDGKDLISGMFEPKNCTVIFWDAVSGEQIKTLDDPYCKDHEKKVIFDVAYSPDGKYVAAAEGEKRAVIWDLQTGEITHELSVGENFVYSVAFSPDGKLLAAGNEDMLTTIWDVSTGSKLKTLEGHTGWVQALAFSSDGKQLLTGSADSKAILWNLEKGTEIFTLAGHAAGVNKVAFSPDGKLIATASDDGTAKIWDADSGSLITTISASAGAVTGLAFNPDGKTLATGSADGAVRFYYVNFEDLLAFAKTRVTRAFTTAECQTFLHVDQCPPTP
jgi:WD40 repeat protein